jgi:hypothetical protein
MSLNLKSGYVPNNPDYFIYNGQSDGNAFANSCNEHLMLLEFNGSMFAFWTQSTNEFSNDQRIVFAKTEDERNTWSNPIKIAGPSKLGEGHRASRPFPLLSKSGRIYVIYNQFQGIIDSSRVLTGTMNCVYSDDLGKSWSLPQIIPLPRSPYDNPDYKFPPNWIVSQVPQHISTDKHFVGFTRVLSPALKENLKNEKKIQESVIEFLRFENIDSNPEPTNIKLSFLGWGNKALRVPLPEDPLFTVAFEPSIVKLPCNRLFCVISTLTGYIWYSLSTDAGNTWCNPKPLLRRDHGQPILGSSQCSIYQLQNDKYILIHNDSITDSNPEDSGFSIILGNYMPDAEQPIWLSKSRKIQEFRYFQSQQFEKYNSISSSCFTVKNENYILWYSIGKTFLVGRKIVPELFTGLEIPKNV